MLIERYLNIRQAYAPSFASDGRHLVFLTDETGVPQAWRVRLPGPDGEDRSPEQLTSGSERVMGVWCSPARLDQRMIIARDQGGNENAQLFLLPAPGGIEIPLTPGHEGAMHTFGCWSEDASYFLFSANRRDLGLFDLYRQPVDGAAELIWRNESPGYLVEPTTSPDGSRVVLQHVMSSFEGQLIEVDLGSGDARRLTSPEEPARYASPRFSPDGHSVYLLTDARSDYLGLARLDLASLNVLSVHSPSADVEILARSPDGRRLAYTVNVDGASELHVCDLEGEQDRLAPLPAESPGVVGWLDGTLVFSPDSRRLGFSLTQATLTSDVYVWDLQSGTLLAATRSSHAGLDPRTFAAPQPIRFPTFDHDQSGAVRSIPGWLYRPRASPEGSLPAIVMVHGGPESQFRPYFNALIQYFLQSGYVVAAPNVRGSTGHGKAFSHLDDGRKRMDAVADLASFGRWLQTQPGIDGRKLAVYGGSYGGFMVLATMTNDPDLWAAGVDIVGVSNFVTFLQNTSDYRRAHREAEYGSLDADREFLESISPLNHIERIRAPLMVIHGANDPRVPLSEAQQLTAALEGSGVPVEMIVFEDEGHGLVKLKNRLVAYPAIVAFLDKHLR